MTSIVEEEYNRRIRELSPAERVERSVAMLNWARNFIARQITTEEGPMSQERLRWRVALRQYGADPAIRKIIERKLNDVSD